MKEPAPQLEGLLSLAELDDLLAAERRSSAQVICIFQRRFGSGAAPVRRGDLDAGSPFSTRMDGTGAPWAAGW